jgi:hypothetical protein
VGVVSGFTIGLSDGTDSFGLIVGLDRGDRAWPELAGRFEQPAAQVLQEFPIRVWAVLDRPRAAGAV